MFDLKDLMSRVNLPQDITRRGFLQVATWYFAFFSDLAGVRLRHPR